MLKRTLRINALVAAAIAVTLVGLGFLLGSWRPNRNLTARSVTTRALQIVDEHGVVRESLFAGKDGDSVIMLRDASDSNLLTLSVGGEERPGPNVTLISKKGHVLASLNVNSMKAELFLAAHRNQYASLSAPKD